MKTSFLIIIVGLIILSSVIFVAIWYSILEECDDKCEHERRAIEAGKIVTGSYELEKPLCLGGRGMILNEDCEIIGKYDVSTEMPIVENKEQYSIEITGLNKIYRIGEQYDFSYVITGYGYSCGSKDVSFPDQNGDLVTISSSGLCAADVPMKNFVFDIQKESGTTYGHVGLKNPGTYNVTVTFDRPSRDSPTTATKEFLVPGINSWYNNRMMDTDDLQTVIDSCANDSSKERMTDSLRYSNGTHVFLNLECKWQKIGQYLGD